MPQRHIEFLRAVPWPETVELKKNSYATEVGSPKLFLRRKLAMNLPKQVFLVVVIDTVEPRLEGVLFTPLRNWFLSASFCVLSPSK